MKVCTSEIKQGKDMAAMCSLCASKKKWDQERVGMGLKVCALFATEIKQDKERAATGSRLCAWCASKKK